MSRLLVICSLFVYASCYRLVPNQPPCAAPLRPVPLTPCRNPQPVRNPVIGCIEPMITPRGNIAEVPINFGNFVLPPCPQLLPVPAPQILPAPVSNYVLPAPLPSPVMSLANPFLPVASPVSQYMPLMSPFLPPASPCNNKCQYLKKIPIPPPCI